MAETSDSATDPWAGWRGRLEASRKEREGKQAERQTNVRKRKGEDYATTANATTSGTGATVTTNAVNKDWPLTKAKIALLYSDTPEVRLTTENEQAAQHVPQFAKRLNATIRAEHVGAAIEEELADVVNAAGISAVVIACEKRTAMKSMPAVDPAIAQQMQAAGQQPPMTDVQATVDIRYPVRRISPSSLLIPAEFTGSVYDKARWLGYDDTMAWATAQAELGLTDEHKEKVLGPDRRTKGGDSLTTDPTRFRDTEAVNFTELFYWRHHYHADETSFTALQRVVFVEGLEEPVINEPYTGQKRMGDRMVGVVRNPIQVLTTTYISDENLPPSDSSISRSQVSELERSRYQMEQQRRHANPVNWFDTNRVSANTKALLEKGLYQGFVPTNGPGDRAIGQVARSAFPPEKHELDAIIEREITDQWQVGPNQMGGYASGERSAREAGIVERNFQTRIGQERAKVERHFVAIAEVLGGLMALHGQSSIPVEMLGSVTYTVRVDSTVLLSAEQRMQQLERQIDRLAQSPFADVRPLLREWLELGGTSPTGVLIDPQPKPPEPVKVSVSKAEDLMNPLFLATLMHTQQGPSPEDVSAAIKALESLAQQMTAAGLGLPMPPQPAGEGGAPAGGPPPRESETPGMANPDWQMAPRMDKRDVD